MFCVAVLMSTYNGEKYISEQIESILNQKDVNVELYIRDDGSSDSTIPYLDELKKLNRNVHVMVAENAGVGNSFMNLVYAVPDKYDYYAFADQDDVWEENKMIEAIKCLEESGKNLYTSNQTLVDKNLDSMGMRFDYIPDVSTLSVISRNPVAGCTMVFTKSFKMKLSEKNSRPRKSLLRNRIHDVWLDAVASLTDDIYYDERSFIKYRQHENNVVGARKETISDRLKAYRKKIGNKAFRNGRSFISKELVRCFPEEAENRPLIKLFADCDKFGSKLEIIKHYKEICVYTHESFFGFCAKVIFNLF